MTTPVTQGSQFFDLLETKSDVEIIALFQGYIDDASTDSSEHEYLDYKNGREYRINTDAGKNKLREEWGQSLSGFANSSGGVVIWGIQTAPKDKHDVPKNFAYIQSPDDFHGLLKNYLGSEVVPPVLNVKFKVVKNMTGEGLVICYIPPSEHKPHQANLTKRWFIRASHQHVDISPDLLRQLFYPQFNPHLKLSLDVYPGGSPAHGYTLRLTLLNDGTVTVKSPYLIVSSDGDVMRYTIPDDDAELEAEGASIVNVLFKTNMRPRLSLSLGQIGMMNFHSKTFVSIFADDMRPYQWTIEGTPDAGVFKISDPERL